MVCGFRSTHDKKLVDAGGAEAIDQLEECRQTITLAGGTWGDVDAAIGELGLESLGGCDDMGQGSRLGIEKQGAGLVHRDADGFDSRALAGQAAVERRQFDGQQVGPNHEHHRVDEECEQEKDDVDERHHFEADVELGASEMHGVCLVRDGRQQRTAPYTGLCFVAVDSTIDYNDAGAVITLLKEAGAHCRGERYRCGSVVRLPAEGWLLATGDLHDNPFHLDKMLNAIRLDKSEDRHIYVHELIHGERLINGMDFSYRMICRVAELKCSRPNQFHPILANHELSQMTGRGVSKGAGDSVALFRDALDFVFGEEEAKAVDQAICEFIRSWPLAIVTEHGVLCAHSVPSEAAMKSFDTTILERDLDESDYEARTGSAYQMTWGRRHSAEHLDRLAEIFGVEVFCLGHEHAETGCQPVGKRGIVLNSDHERGAVLPIDLSSTPLPSRDELMWSMRQIASL